MFVVGLGLIVYEATIYTGPERWGLMMLYAGMVGSPVFLRYDEKRTTGDRPPTPTPPTPPAPAPEDAS